MATLKKVILEVSVIKLPPACHKSSGISWSDLTLGSDEVATTIPCRGSAPKPQQWETIDSLELSSYNH